LGANVKALLKDMGKVIMGGTARKMIAFPVYIEGFLHQRLLNGGRSSFCVAYMYDEFFDHGMLSLCGVREAGLCKSGDASAH